jgi:hypothetical protein
LFEFLFWLICFVVIYWIFFLVHIYFISICEKLIVESLCRKIVIDWDSLTWKTFFHPQHSIRFSAEISPSELSFSFKLLHIKYFSFLLWIFIFFHHSFEFFLSALNKFNIYFFLALHEPNNYSYSNAFVILRMLQFLWIF